MFGGHGNRIAGHDEKPSRSQQRIGWKNKLHSIGQLPTGQIHRHPAPVVQLNPLFIRIPEGQPGNRRCQDADTLEFQTEDHITARAVRPGALPPTGGSTPGTNKAAAPIRVTGPVVTASPLPLDGVAAVTGPSGMA